MGSNFLVAAFVPALAFILICLITFDPMLPKSLRYMGDDPSQLLQSTLKLILFTTILGFTLYTLSTYIYKAFEGYTFILGRKGPLRSSFMRRQVRRFNKIEKERLQVERQLKKIQESIDKLPQDPSSKSWQARRYNRYASNLEKAKDRQYELVATRDGQFPPSKNLIMPTRFGNILKAAETYPVTRYKIDSVQLWGRLSHIIPDTSMEKIDHASNQSLFLLNSSLLTSLFIVLCIAATIYQAVLLYAKLNNLILLPSLTPTLDAGFYQEKIIIYPLLALFSSVIAWFFYEASLINVSQFGDMIRASYDLYRFKLLEALHFPLPENLKEEREWWLMTSQFMVGNEAFGPVNPDYLHPEK
jgi:hypothetical protein